MAKQNAERNTKKAATNIGVVGASEAAMNPERSAGIAEARACTEALMPSISPCESRGAIFERRLVRFAIVSPVQSEKNGGISKSCQETRGRKYARIKRAPPTSDHFTIVG